MAVGSRLARVSPVAPADSEYANERFLETPAGATEVNKRRLILKAARLMVLVLLLLQIGYLSYRVPQIILLGQSFPQTIKLSLVLAGLFLGVLYILKIMNRVEEASDTSKDQLPQGSGEEQDALSSEEQKE